MYLPQGTLLAFVAGPLRATGIALGEPLLSDFVNVATILSLHVGEDLVHDLEQLLQAKISCGNVEYIANWQVWSK
jgi:hypothetical protein